MPRPEAHPCASYVPHAVPHAVPTKKENTALKIPICSNMLRYTQKYTIRCEANYQLASDSSHDAFSIAFGEECRKQQVGVFVLPQEIWRMEVDQGFRSDVL